MRTFDYTVLPRELLTADTMNLLTAVREQRGRQGLYLLSRPELLDALYLTALVQSTGASNRIEGIRTSDRRLRDIMEHRSPLASRAEKEIAGYRDVLATIHENRDHLDVTTNIILQMHRDLYRHTAASFGGRFKSADNEIQGIRPDGTAYVRFRPVAASRTPDAVDRLCSALRVGMAQEAFDPLLMSLTFVFDFICIHPFTDGNGRMSRLLTLLLLYRCGYEVGRYISIEREIERTKGAYYDALALSSEGWDDGCNDVGPFVRYMLGTILAAYRDFGERAEAIGKPQRTKTERVEAVLREHLGKIGKSEIAAICPDISATTIERTLAALLKAGKIEKVGAGRGTAYVWKG